MSCPGFAVRVLVAFLSRSWYATPDRTAIGEWSSTPCPRCGRPKPSTARWVSSPSPLTTTIRSRALSIWPSTCNETEIATAYDKARALAPETLRLSPHIDRAAISLVMTSAAARGRFSEVLAPRFGVHVIGIDPSEKMVGQARRKLATG